MNKLNLKTAIICALIANFFFGLISPMSKFATLGHMDGITLASLRIMGAAALFWIASIFAPKQAIEKRDWLPIILMSLCGMALNQGLFTEGVSLTSPSSASLAVTMGPIFTVVLACIFYRQHISLARIGGILLALAGVVLMVMSTAQDGSTGNLLGDAMCLGSQFFAACYFLFFAKLLQRYNPIVLMKWLFLISSIAMLPLVGRHLIEFPWAQLSTGSILSSAFVVFFGTFIAYLLLLPAQKILPAAIVVFFLYINPVVATSFSIGMGLESFCWFELLAALMIGLGVWIVQHYGLKEQEQAH